MAHNPPRRLLLAAALLVVAAGCAGDAGETTSTTGALQPTSTSLAGPTTTTSMPPSSSTTTTATTTSTAGGAPPTRPLPFDSWTAVLASLPVAENTAEQARTVAEKLGVPAAGVLLSDDYPSLNPGFWVIYTRPYEFSWEAAAACGEVANLVSDCYPRYLGGDPNEPVGYEAGTIVAVTEDAQLVVVSATSGEVIRTIDTSFGGDGSYPSAPALAADGLTIDYSVGAEDFWFSCDASDGHLERLDLATGRTEKSGDGFYPRVSLDGVTLLYLASSDCYPDPAEPQFVLAPIDTIVLRDVVTGSEVRQIVPLSGDVDEGYELWNVIEGLTSVFVLDTAGSVWSFSPETGGVAAGELVADLAAAGLDSGGYRLIGYDTVRNRLLVAYNYFDTDSEFTELYAMDVATGDIEQLAVYEGPSSFALDHTGRHLAVAAEGELIIDGTTVASEVRVVAVAW